MVDLKRIKEIIDQESANLGVNDETEIYPSSMGAEWITPNGAIRLVACKTGEKLSAALYTRPNHNEYVSSLIARKEFDSEAQFELFLKQVLPRAEEELQPREQHV